MKSNTKQVTIVIGLIILISALIIKTVNDNILNDYMDEEFHLSQTVMYYNNNYTYWNNKLTTFPGVFFLGSIWLKLLNGINLLSQSFILPLRLLTVIMSIATTYTLSLFANNKENNGLSFIMTMSLFPFLFFYNFLFYTDTYSNLFLTLFFYCSLNQKNSLFKGLCACLSVLVRQNNIIWINLLPLSKCIKLLKEILSFDISLVDIITRAINIIITYIHIVIIDLFFVVFLFKNDFSVVLGDKSHHELSFHLAQWNHLIFFVLLSFPFLALKIFQLFNPKDYSSKNKSYLRLLLIFAIVICVMLFFNTYSYTHDFILSDNRHYSFYYFRKIYNATVLRYTMIVFSSLILTTIINDNIEVIYDNNIMAWAICTSLALVPAKLFEVRYFVPCILIILLLMHSSYTKYAQLLQTVFNYYHVFYFIIIDAIVLSVFIYYPFKNEFFDSKYLSRFMF